MEERILQEEKFLYSHLTEQEWKKSLTSNVQELGKWVLTSASLGRYFHRLEIPSWVHQRELEELIFY